MKIISRDLCRRLCFEALPLPNPDFDDQDKAFYGAFICDENGIFHFFHHPQLHVSRILETEKKVFQKKRKQGIRYPKLILSAN